MFAMPLVWLAIIPVNSSADSAPLLQLRPDGPLGLVHSLRFSQDGSTLYCGGNLKAVQVWKRKDNRFERIHSASLRQKIGPGPLGAIRTMSVSDDGRYVVVGGVATFDDHADFSTDGIMIPSFGWTRQMLDQVGMVTLFDVKTKQTRRVKTHSGYVLAAQVVSSGVGKTSYLITVGNDQDPGNCNENGLKLERSLRVFRIDNGQELQRWRLPVTNVQPRLVTWQDNVNAGANGLRIAVTLADGTPGGGVQIFQPGVMNPIKVANEYGLDADRLPPPLNNPNTFSLCVASYRGLTLWNGQNGNQRDTISLETQLLPNEVIYRLASIKSRPNMIVATTKDLAVQGAQHHLRLIDLNQDRCLLGKGIPIGNRQNPVVATDPTGTFVAATADVADGIKIFDCRQLLNGNLNPIQELRCEFQSIERARLVSRDDRNVLRFTIRRDSKDETFDLIDGGLRTVDDDAAMDAQGTVVKFRQSADKKLFVSSTPIAGKTGQLKIESSLPPVAKTIASKLIDGRRIVAVGFQENIGEAQIRLSLYDGASGQELRRLSGHQQMISRIEYSADHQYLTTVSADGVVCVWKLGDLADHIANRAAIHGVRWCLINQSVVVTGVDEDSGANRLQPGDTLIGIVDGDNQLNRYNSAEQLFLAISHHKPKSTVKLRVDRNGVISDIPIALGHATDERKPHFSFVCEMDNRHDRLSWLAWSPSGPFQSSGPEIERRAGWHFNPETDDGNVRFAPFAEYRDEFFGETLVRDLLALGRLPDVWPPPFEAHLAARFIDQQGQSIDPDESREYRPEKPLTAMEVFVADVPAQFVSGLSMQVDDEDPIMLSRSKSDPDIWVGENLPESINEPTEHRVSMVLRGSRISGGEHRDWVSVYSNNAVAAPVVQAELPELRLISHAPRTQIHIAKLDDRQRVAVEVEVDAEAIPEESEFVALRNQAAVKLHDLQTTGNRMKASIPLREGINRIQVQLKRGNAATVTPAVEFDVINPPSVAPGIKTAVNQNNTGRLSFDYRSVRPPVGANFRLLIDGVPQRQWRIAATANRLEENLYRVDLYGFPLSVGPNRVELEVRDRNGITWQRQSMRIVGAPKPKQPQLALFVADGAAFQAAHLDVDAHIVSKDLHEIRCHIGEQRIAVNQPKKNALGSYFVTLRLPLDVGTNHITVSVVSQAGLVATQSRTVTRVQRPVEFIAQHFVVPGSDPIELSDSLQGTFEPARPIPTAKGTVEGFVRLSQSAAETHDGKKVIRAWVNGFLQSVVRLETSENPRQMRFSIPVTLSAKENEIRIDLPGLAESEESIARINAECEQPSRDQTLHLLVLSTHVKREQREQYEKRVLDLLGVKNGKMPAFEHVLTGDKYGYPALTGTYCRSGRVRPMIERIRLKLYRKQGENNMLLIYFQGDELRSSNGSFCLLTHDVQPKQAFDPKFKAITSTYLGDRLAGLKCANLLFLDVAPHDESAPSPNAGDPDQPRLGVLRMQRDRNLANVSSPLLLSQVQKVLPRVAELGELAHELEQQVRRTPNLFVNESIPSQILRMPFGIMAN